MKFRFRKGIFLFFCIMFLLFTFFTIKGVGRSGLNAGGSVLILLLIFLLILDFKAYIISMDMMIDDNGICRICFGRKVFFLKWSDIKVVRDIEEKNLSGPALRSFYIIPHDRSLLSVWSGGWIRFTDNMYNFPAFVDVMNKKIRSHNIRIELVRGVNTTIRDEIFVSDVENFKIP